MPSKMIAILIMAFVSTASFTTNINSRYGGHDCATYYFYYDQSNKIFYHTPVFSSCYSDNNYRDCVKNWFKGETGTMFSGIYSRDTYKAMQTFDEMMKGFRDELDEKIEKAKNLGYSIKKLWTDNCTAWSNCQ